MRKLSHMILLNYWIESDNHNQIWENVNYLQNQEIT